MTEIAFMQSSPKGNAMLDTHNVLVDTDGRTWIVSGAATSHGLTPASGEQLAALHDHFGANWSDAVAAMAALVD